MRLVSNRKQHIKKLDDPEHLSQLFVTKTTKLSDKQSLRRAQWIYLSVAVVDGAISGETNLCITHAYICSKIYAQLMHIIFHKKHLLSLGLPCILQSTQLYVRTSDIFAQQHTLKLKPNMLCLL